MNPAQINTTAAIADKLDDMQSKQNNGRGVTCVCTIVYYLRKDDMDSARAVARNESDKLWQYPDIREFIHKNLEPIGFWNP
jgi:predicted cupin superfamily sugar epimerase